MHKAKPSTVNARRDSNNAVSAASENDDSIVDNIEREVTSIGGRSPMQGISPPVWYEVGRGQRTTDVQCAGWEKCKRSSAENRQYPLLPRKQCWQMPALR